MIRATKGNLKEVILDAMMNAAEEIHEKSYSHIRNAPEYLLNVYIGQHICRNFEQVGFRLEYPVRELLGGLGLSESEASPDIRTNGKFDILLISRKSGNPRHVIEVKRSFGRTKLIQEAIRIKALAEAKHDSKRLKTGFIAAIRRKRNRSLKTKEILDRREQEIRDILGKNYKVSAYFDEKLENTCGFENGESLAVAVIEITKIS